MHARGAGGGEMFGGAMAEQSRKQTMKLRRYPPLHPFGPSGNMLLKPSDILDV